MSRDCLNENKVENLAACSLQYARRDPEQTIGSLNPEFWQEGLYWFSYLLDPRASSRTAIVFASRMGVRSRWEERNME